MQKPKYKKEKSKIIDSAHLCDKTLCYAELLWKENTVKFIGAHEYCLQLYSN